MSLKEYRDDWETWSKGKKIGSIIIGCCVLTLLLSLIAGMLTPDANDNYDSDIGDDSIDYTEPFRISAENIKVESSSIDITDQQTKSTSYAYFYEDTGEYAEPAYISYTSDEIHVKLNMKNLNLSEDSQLNYNDMFGNHEFYNKSYLLKDINKLIKDDGTSISLQCYDKNDSYLYSYNDLKVSMKKGILTLSYSNSTTSDYHTKYSHTPDKVDHARVVISGLINGTNSSREVEFNLVSNDMKVNMYT